jgi:hypothetical protein
VRYKAKSVAALQLALGRLPDQMRVEMEPDIGVSAKTLAELRKVTAWPENLAITTSRLWSRHSEEIMQLNLGILLTGSLDWESKDYGGACREALMRHGRLQNPAAGQWRNTLEK